MCFKNLPIEFDGGGKARLKEGVTDPYSVTVAEPKGYVRRKEGPGAQLAAPPGTVSVRSCRKIMTGASRETRLISP